MKALLRYWLPPLLWCTIIFVQSCYATPDVVPHWPYLDKVLHMGVYGLLGFLFCRALGSLPSLMQSRLRVAAIAGLLTALFGLSDEFHQSFVPARTADVVDLLADLVGGLSGSIFYLWFRAKIEPYLAGKSPMR